MVVISKIGLEVDMEVDMEVAWAQGDKAAGTVVATETQEVEKM